MKSDTEEERVQQRLVEVDRPIRILGPLRGRRLLEGSVDFVGLRMVEGVVVADYHEPVQLAEPLL